MKVIKITKKTPLTERQLSCLISTRRMLDEIQSPDNYNKSRSYEFIKIKHSLGHIPSIRFNPNPNHIKSEIREHLDDPAKDEKLNQIREKYGWKEIKNRSARNWNSCWSSFMQKVKEDMANVIYANILFPDAVKLMEEIIYDEYPEIKALSKDFPINQSQHPKDNTQQYQYINDDYETENSNNINNTEPKRAYE